ncbi:MAG TPA: hypothetical protein VKU00_33570, partial [Chthonomonadaceae bacterium]|nr:hypothetical protein [Chthonomonadaceae bacterium]
IKGAPRYLSDAVSGLVDHRIIKPNTGSINDLLSGPDNGFHTPDYPDYHPRPHSLRWVCSGTTTDAGGAFTLNDLTTGEYLLVCTLPPDLSPTPPSDPALRVDHGPSILTLDTDRPKVDLGTISLSYTH